MRERGLKSPKDTTIITDPNGRSREGAWIEIAAGSSAKAANRGRSREGAWIEIVNGASALSANYRSLP